MKHLSSQPAFIVGVGHHLPTTQVSNAALAPKLGVDAEGIQRRTGIQTRHWVSGRVYTSDLAAHAAEQALHDARLRAADIDCIIAATMSPDYHTPGIGVLTQAKLGVDGVPCFDIRAQCSGFIYGLCTASAFVRAGTFRSVLLVCAELQSHGLGMTPAHAHVTPLFGDGAAAVIVGHETRQSDHPLALEWSRVYADGRGAPYLRQRIFDISLDPYWDIDQLGEPREAVIYGEMNGEKVFRRAIKTLTRVAHECLDSTGLSIADIDWLLPHQANDSINRTVSSIVGVPPEKLLSNIDRVGNTSSASIPLLLSETLAAGRIARGHRVLTLAFGSGFTWGGALLRRC